MRSDKSEFTEEKLLSQADPKPGFILMMPLFNLATSNLRNVSRDNFSLNEYAYKSECFIIIESYLQKNRGEEDCIT